jgi:hypothetical protein
MPALVRYRPAGASKLGDSPGRVRLSFAKPRGTSAGEFNRSTADDRSRNRGRNADVVDTRSRGLYYRCSIVVHAHQPHGKGTSLVPPTLSSVVESASGIEKALLLLEDGSESYKSLFSGSREASIGGSVFAMLHLDYLSCFLTVLATILLARKSRVGLLIAIANSLIVRAIGLRTAQLYSSKPILHLRIRVQHAAVAQGTNTHKSSSGAGTR